MDHEQIWRRMWTVSDGWANKILLPQVSICKSAGGRGGHLMDIEKLIKRLKCPQIQSCPMDGEYLSCKACQKSIKQDAATALSTLQAENEKLRAELERVKRERDAAVEGLRVCSIENNMECQYCLYRTARSFCWNCTDGSNWKWRGQKEE